MKILLVYPSSRSGNLIGSGDLGAIAEPLALEYVGAAARCDDHEVEILDLRLHPDEFPLRIHQFQPDVIGVTGYSIFTPLPGTEFLKNFDEITELQANGRSNWDLFDLQHPVVATNLPRDRFMSAYHELYQCFSEKYSVYRDKLRLRNREGVLWG